MFEGLFRGEHLLIILLVVLVLFPNKLGQVGGSLGRSIRDFKKAMNEPDQDQAAPQSIAALPEKGAEGRTPVQ